MPHSEEGYVVIYFPSDLQRHGVEPGQVSKSQLEDAARQFFSNTIWGADRVRFHHVSEHEVRGDEPAGLQLEIHLFIDCDNCPDIEARAEAIRTRITQDFLDAEFGIKIDSPPDFTDLTRVAKPLFA